MTLNFVPKPCPAVADSKGKYDEEAFLKLLERAPTWKDSQFFLSPAKMQEGINNKLYGGTQEEAPGASEVSTSDESTSEVDDVFNEFLNS